MSYIHSNGIGSNTIDTASDRAIALKVFSGEVLTSFAEKNIFLGLVQTRTIASGKSAQFPVIGSYEDAAATHVPGTDIDVKGIAAAERVITIDDLKYASVFVDNFEEAMAHYEVRGQYSMEMGRKLARTVDSSIVAELQKCTDGTASALTGQPAATTAAIDAGVLTTDSVEEAGNKIISAIFNAQSVLDGKDVPGERYVVVSPADYYKIVQSSKGVNSDYTVSNGGIDTGKVTKIAGNNILVSTNLSANQIFVFTSNAVGVVKLLDIKTESNYIPEKLGDLMTSSYAMGFGVLNPGCVVELDTTAA
jgi:hypothetical protein